MKEQSGDSLCLCGSGRQYKNCCLEKCIEFPQNNSFEDIPNSVSVISNSAQTHIENKNISSFKEIKKELTQFFNSHNRKPMDDFLGITPSQMHHILCNPFNLTNVIFRFEYGDNFEKNINKIPFLEQTLYFLNSLFYDVNKEHSFFDPKTEIVNCFNIRFLNEVCLLWGLLERKVENRGLNTTSYYKLSPFFKQHFKFKD